MISKHPKILIISGNSGVAFWRLKQPGEFLQKKGLADVKFVDARELPANIGELLQWCDFVWSTGWMDITELVLLRKYRALGVRVVLDYDDLYFNVSPFNTAYRNLGTEEVQVRDPQTGDIKYLWKDGVDGFDLKKNQMKFHAWKDTILEADIITTTTVHLKQAIMELTGRSEEGIKVLPNALDLEQWKPLDVREKFDDKFRFGWSVSASHGEDWLFIKPALKEFLSRHKDAKFVVLGDTHMDVTGIAPGQVEWYPFSNLYEYHYSLRMPMLALDCAIAPLADLEFNRCKSPLKYAEYTAFGWPVIAQNMEPYSSHIVHGETGMLAKTTEDWIACLESLYNNPGLRKKLRFNALFTIKELFDLDKVAEDYATTFRELIS